MSSITIRNESGRRTRLSTLRTALQTLLSHYDVPGKNVDVLITDDATMRRLNQEFRSIDEATDVLTFPGPDWPGAPLGDIAISVEFAERGAAHRSVPVHEELAYLGIHGGLHLLGYEDQTDKERDEMVDRMNAIAEAAGIRADRNWSSQPHDTGSGASSRG